MRWVNFGCGEDVLDGWENYDLYSDDPRVLKLDLTKLPLPFDDKSVDEIRLKAVLEHIDVVPHFFMLDCWRILKPGGTIYVVLPGFSAELTHLRWYHPICYFNALIADNPGVNRYYTKSGLFELKKLENNFSFKMFFRKLYETFISMGSSEISWTMVKR